MEFYNVRVVLKPELPSNFFESLSATAKYSLLSFTHASSINKLYLPFALVKSWL